MKIKLRTPDEMISFIDRHKHSALWGLVGLSFLIGVAILVGAFMAWEFPPKA